MDWETSPIVIIGVATALYAAVHIGLAFAMRQCRMELVDIAESILADPKVSPKTKETVDHLIDTCMSFKVAVLIPVAVVSAIFDSLLRVEAKEDHLPNDERLHQLSKRYFASVLTANPLLGLLAAAFMAVGGFILVALQKGASDGTPPGNAPFGLEVPMLRASNAVMTA